MWRIVAAALLLTVLVTCAGCDDESKPGVLYVCPDPGSGRSWEVLYKTAVTMAPRVERSSLPGVFANANGQEIELASGPSDWCGIHSDVFELQTFVEPLRVSVGDEVTIDNPLPDEKLFQASANIQGPFAVPAAQPGSRWLVWPKGGWIGSFGSEFEDDGRISFEAPDLPGNYVVSVSFGFERTADMFATSNRHGAWALYLVVED